MIRKEDIKQAYAWCQAFIGGNPNGTVVSHGICESYAEKLLKEDKDKRGKAS